MSIGLGIGLAFPRSLVVVLDLSGVASGGVTGSAYSYTPDRAGGNGPFVYSVVSGALPAWAALNASTGQISGATPTLGSTTFTLRVRDALGQTDDLVLTIVISAPGSGGQLDFSDPANSALIV